MGRADQPPKRRGKSTAIQDEESCRLKFSSGECSTSLMQTTENSVSFQGYEPSSSSHCTTVNRFQTSESDALTAFNCWRTYLLKKSYRNKLNEATKEACKDKTSMAKFENSQARKGRVLANVIVDSAYLDDYRSQSSEDALTELEEHGAGEATTMPELPRKVGHTNNLAESRQIVEITESKSSNHRGSVENDSKSLLKSKSTDVAKYVAWKWRWVVATAKAQRLAEELEGLKQGCKIQPSDHVSSEQGPHFMRSLRTSLEKELETSLPDIKLLSFVLSFWQVYSAFTKGQKSLILKSFLLHKLIALLPKWFIEAGKRNLLSHFFFRWHASLDRHSSVQNMQTGYSSFYDAFRHTCYPKCVNSCQRHISGDSRALACSTAFPPPYPVKIPRARTKVFDAKAAVDKMKSHAFIPEHGRSDKSQMQVIKCVTTTNPVRNNPGIHKKLANGSFYLPDMSSNTFTSNSLRKLQLQLEKGIYKTGPLLIQALEMLRNKDFIREIDNGDKAICLRNVWAVCIRVFESLTEAQSVVYDNCTLYTRREAGRKYMRTHYDIPQLEF